MTRNNNPEFGNEHPLKRSLREDESNLEAQEWVGQRRAKDASRPSVEHLGAFRCAGCKGSLGFDENVAGIGKLIYHAGCAN